MTDAVGKASSTGSKLTNLSLPSKPLGHPVLNGSVSNSSIVKDESKHNVTRNSAPNEALQRWGINMAPILPDNHVTTNVTSTSLPEFPHHTKKNVANRLKPGQATVNPSTPGGAKRRAELAMSIINSMAGVADAIADGTVKTRQTNRP